eukprot:CAMPEP_0117431628 /NCGR_PEP_ID=MMETSP0758-20121206/11157_1 /TAXON_ID=63605 /ORGANISM="Percolomonas cosmopolitus, Strain AE-1 (ATCC 50343)" /LENGTH=165 /DNA_ID=CAMNT_0005220817 /DNA_START=751 /DNA_END=1244 /DNA_ORIENTATION=+
MTPKTIKIPGLPISDHRLSEQQCSFKSDEAIVMELQEEYPDYDFFILSDRERLLSKFRALPSSIQKQSFHIIENARSDLQLNRLALRRIGNTYLHQLSSFEAFSNSFELSSLPPSHSTKVRQDIQSWLQQQYELMVIDVEEKVKVALASLHSPPSSTTKQQKKYR